jgi:photosystem II stability/assembly factor-like uncharacterized protein
MRFLLFLFLFVGAAAAAQSELKPETSHTTESLRGVSAVSRDVAWASGTHGTYLVTTDRGSTWTAAQVRGAESLDFRAVVAFSANEAFLMSAGPGEQSRIYHTSDGGKNWQLQFTNHNPKGFFDSMAFWDAKHGIVLGDPIPDEASVPKGALKFDLLLTEDGENWHRASSAHLPAAMEGEGAFAASNTCLAILAGTDQNVWFATGGKVARVFHSADRGQTWQVFDTPIVHGADSAGIFSIAFRDAQHGVIAGGDYKHPEQDGPNLAFTEDGGKTWKLSDLRPQAYFSGVAYERASGKSSGRMFVVGQNFVLRFGSGHPQRLDAEKNSGFNAVSAFPEGGAIVVGAKGTIALIP